MTPKLLDNLRCYTPPPDSFGMERRAAVLVPLREIRPTAELEVLLTVRSSTLRKHGGEVALPGGRHEDGDDMNLLATALREAEEEVGLPQTLVKGVTVLPPFLSRFQLLVTPVVGIIPRDFEPVPNPEEVAECFNVPLHIFLHSQSDRTKHEYIDIRWRNGVWRRHAFWWRDAHGKEFKIWGLTADILIQVAQIAYGRKAEFEVSAPDQPHIEYLIEALDAAGTFGSPIISKIFKSAL
ncbi:NUDIX hydrolase domain-like protein [Phlyctochytrium arcticum]|nr:NUDIX hydrolase domain-like protein [Phlyctochytrium arcticum]